MLEVQRARLNRPPLGAQGQRTPEQMAQAEIRTETPVGEYIDAKERHMQRVAFEVLRISGLPFETSASLAKTIFDLHREQWERNEDPATRTAIGEMTVPTTPLDRNAPDPVKEALDNAPVDETYTPTEEENEMIRQSRADHAGGDFYSLEVVMRSHNGEIPALQPAPQKPRL